jgi:hypothetical protein
VAGDSGNDVSKVLFKKLSCSRVVGGLKIVQDPEVWGSRYQIFTRKGPAVNLPVATQVAGDSGNDVSMFLFGTDFRGVMVRSFRWLAF